MIELKKLGSNYNQIKMSITVEELQKQVHNLAREKGWWELSHDFTIDTERNNIPEKLMLMVSELGEALEHYRGSDGITTWFINEVGNKELYHGNITTNSKPDGFWVELADCIIRILDLAGAYDINMEELVKLKHNYNKTRPYRHGGKKC